MEKQYLTHSQSLNAARIFLNAFGLILEDVNSPKDVNESTKLNIYNKDMNVVGELKFNGKNISLDVNDNKLNLKANYEIAPITTINDHAFIGSTLRRWVNKISFTCEVIDDSISSEPLKIDGKFDVGASTDTEHDLNCTCHPLLNIKDFDETIKLLRDRKMFAYYKNSENYNEKIEITPFSYSTYLSHDIKLTDNRAYRKYCGIFAAPLTDDDKEQLHVFSRETYNEKEISSRSDMVQAQGSNNHSLNFIQKGMLMKELDPGMYDKINKLREKLSFNGVSLLDNLFSICYDNFQDEELDALLGIKRDKMTYQDGSDNLTDSYFKIKREKQKTDSPIKKKIK